MSEPRRACIISGLGSINGQWIFARLVWRRTDGSVFLSRMRIGFELLAAGWFGEGYLKYL
jgi:hypothetical protein